jgi:hypothetical protein
MAPYDQIPQKYRVEVFRKHRPYNQQPVTLTALERECRVYEAEEPRDAMYRVSKISGSRMVG